MVGVAVGEELVSAGVHGNGRLHAGRVAPAGAVGDLVKAAVAAVRAAVVPEALVGDDEHGSAGLHDVGLGMLHLGRCVCVSKVLVVVGVPAVSGRVLVGGHHGDDAVCGETVGLLVHVSVDATVNGGALWAVVGRRLRGA